MNEKLKTSTVTLNFISGKMKNLFDICDVKSTDDFALFIDTEQVVFGFNINQIFSYRIIPDEEEEE